MTTRHSWEVLPAAPIKQSGAISACFLAHGLRDYRDAARFVSELPYGRNSARTATCEVLTEGHGTCSTKHALLAALAAEQQIPVALMLGTYEMNAVNTPGGRNNARAPRYRLPARSALLRLVPRPAS